MLYVKRMWMDHMESPLGVDAIPTFGWVMESDGTNVRQTAYRLQIAREEDFGAIIYDSGRVKSDESAYVRLEGVTLTPCARYFTRVKAWDDAEESDWSAAHSFVTAMLGGGWKARFISAESEGDGGCSKGTYLRKSLRIDKPVREAFVCATALGLYSLSVNGRVASDDRMAPGWTSYRHHLRYQTYDVTALLRDGENVLGAHVGAGWYKGMMGFYFERNNYGDCTAFLLQMIVRYEDGTEETFVTDQTWLGCASPVTFSEIYDGERYDARLEQPGWDAPGFVPTLGGEKLPAPLNAPYGGESPTDEQKARQRALAEAYQPTDTLWRPVSVVDFPLSTLTAQPGCRVTVTQELPVKSLLITPKGETVLDFGQNLTGCVRFRVRGREGEVARIRLFETLDAEGNAYFDNLRSAKAEVRYVCRGDDEAWYEENFSFQGFRYALIAEFPAPVRAEDFVARVLHSDMPVTGTFSCSDERVNQLQRNIEWSLRGNFLDIPTDCPQRDERLGWTGDAQVFCRTAAFLRNVYPFFAKWLRDVKHDQLPDGGVPHVVPDLLSNRPTKNRLLSQGQYGATAWADAAVINPWTMYAVYGDRRILEDQFDSMKMWVDFMTAHAEGCVWTFKAQFGDWLALDAKEGGCEGATPNDLICAAYYARSTLLFVKTCRALGRDALAEEYQALYEGIVRSFADTFLDENGVMTVQTQTAHALALRFNLIPEKGRRGTVAGLARLIEESGGHLTTGFVGTPCLCHALSENGRADIAYDLLLREEFPSWLYEVKAGATTIWEHWDGVKPDKSMWSAAMNSFNHYAYGAIGEWLYGVTAGIETDDARPGFKRAVLRARTTDRMTFARASFDSVYGEYVSSWERVGRRVTRAVRVPVNASALVILEDGADDIESALPFVRNTDGLWQAEALSGEWVVRYSLSDARGI